MLNEQIVDGPVLTQRTGKNTSTYFGILQIRAIVVAHFSVVDNIATPFGVCSHGSRPVALVVPSIDLLGC